MQRFSPAPSAIVAALIVLRSPPMPGMTVVSIDGEPTTFDGALGLAPQWLSGPCNGDCQEWVSACLLARTNLTGIADVEVVLWIDDPSSSDDPDPDYTYEAGFFGNLFTSSSGYLCQDPAGLLSSVTAARVCSVTTGCLIPLTNRYAACRTAPPLGSARCDGEPGTPHHAECRAGLLPSGSDFHTINAYIQPDVVDLVADLLGL